MGSGATGAGDDAVAIGSDADAQAAAAESVALGYNATTTAARATAIGKDSTASATDALAAGTSATASGAGAVALGGDSTNAATAATAAAVAAGANVLADGIGSVALGRGQAGGLAAVNASGAGAFAHSGTNGPNEQAIASADHGYAHGEGPEASHEFSRATGEFSGSQVKGHVVHAGGSHLVGVSRTLRDGQTGTAPLGGITTGAAGVRMGQDPQVVPAVFTFPLGTNRACTVRGRVQAIADDGAGGLDVCMFAVEFHAENNGGVTAIKADFGTTSDPDATGWTLVASAVAGGWLLTMTGAAGATVWWQGHARVDEVAKPH
jgi:hypothetical protein